ncbi:hypothetical protein QBC41DRAFT_324564 [Cercophora samala]|uniref:Uncharacterized protein n=1 Tax=Cercophora samala TaxID=330535 RepID=A0AA40D8F7_9PEZI|nr:hypothetical protein QBC41DRAFT_324564 [Cercophora samala]
MISRKRSLAVVWLLHLHRALSQDASNARYSTASGFEYTRSTGADLAPLPTSEPQPSSGPALSSGAQAGIITGSALLFFLVLSLAVYFFHLRKTNRQSPPSPGLHPGLSTRPSNQHLISSPLQTPKRARTPLSFPFSNSKRGDQEQQGTPLSPSALDVVRERLEMESMGLGYQQDRRNNRREAKSVVESLDWDWKKVYVYPFTSSASSRGSVYSTSEGAAGLEEGRAGPGLGSYWEVSSGGSNGGSRRY